MRIVAAGLGLLLIAAAPNPQSKVDASPVDGPEAGASLSRWGVLEEIARREWTTEKEPRPRVSKFRWIDEGRVLEARHGFVSRLQFGEAKFADTVQRFVLNEKTGAIDVTYTYEDGRPPLKTVIRIQPDGAAVETFTDAGGVEHRNTYRSPSLSVNSIAREKKQGEAWAMLGTTRKSGLTAEEIAENKRRAEEARQMAIAEANARKAAEYARQAAEQAQREAEQAAYAQQEAELQADQQRMVSNMNAGLMDAIRGIGQAVQDRNRQQAELNRLRIAAEQETAQRRADAARAEANRIAAENARRVQEANARQAAIAQQYAQRQADSQAQASANAAQAEADRARRAEAQRQAAEAERTARAEEQRQAAEAERRRREAQAQAEAERRRQAEQQRLAEQRRKEEEARRPVAFKEGVVACEKRNPNSREYRCDGPLQVTYSDLVSPAGLVSIGQACGGGSTRDLGTSGGYRIFGCGFGIHPTDRNYPGNRDVPAALGLYIPSRATFHCPRTTNAYCRGR